MNNENNQKYVERKGSFMSRISQATKKNWIKFIIMAVLCVAFILWTGYLLVFLLIPLFFDSYILKYIPWSFWKNSKNTSLRKIMEWADAIGFALVAVWVINTFFFQNYQIPSSSLEKSLLVGDFLFVSKMSYGTRSPMTPFSFPLAQHTLPVFDIKSYLDNPQVKYQRFKGFGSIERGNIVVFNFPAGDTVALKNQMSDYYTLSKLEPNGRADLWSNKSKYGDIVYRPVDRRENYVKRAMGLPGETIEIKDDQVYIDGNKVANPENMQLMYFVQTDGTQLSDKLIDELGISKDDFKGASVFDPLQIFRQENQSLTTSLESDAQRFATDSIQLTQMGFVAKGKSFGLVYTLPLTKKMIATLESKPFILSVFKIKERIYENYELENGTILPSNPFYYPLDFNTKWTRDSYGPLWIPKKGETITFDSNVDYKVAAYERVIKNYEGNDFDYKDGKVYINGKPVDSYTFKMDYYFMMGDNRHNSADSRSWGFVPEDHIVGQPLFVWLSLDKDKGWFDGKIRWNRIFTSAKKD